VLFVSHNMQAVRALCERGILLEGGQMIDDGPTDAIVRRYLTSVEPLETGRRRWDDPATRPGDDSCRLVEVRVADAAAETKSTFFSSEAVSVVVELDVLETLQAAVVAVDLVASDGTAVLRSYSTDAGDVLRPGLRRGRTALRCEVPANLLNAGRYVVHVRVFVRGIDGIIWAPSVLHFDITADHGESYFLSDYHARPGVVAPVLPWEEIDPVDEDAAVASPAPGAAAAHG